MEIEFIIESLNMLDHEMQCAKKKKKPDRRKHQGLVLPLLVSYSIGWQIELDIFQECNVHCFMRWKSVLDLLCIIN